MQPIAQLALQHALTREIRLSSELKPLLRHFMASCIHRLSLAGAHIYLNNDAPNTPPTHYLTLPAAHPTPPHHFNVFASTLAQHRDAPATQPFTLNDGKRDWHVFHLPATGIIVLERFHGALSTEVVDLLQPVMVHLGRAIDQGLEHERQAAQISHLTRATQDAQTNETRLGALLDNCGDGIITTDERGTIHFINRPAQHMFGYRADDIIGHNIQHLVQTHADNAQAIPVPDAPDTALAGIRRDGSTFPVELTVSDLHIDGQAIFCGIVRDATDKQQRERGQLNRLRTAQGATQLAHALANQRTLADALAETTRIVGQHLGVDRVLAYHIELDHGSITEHATWPHRPAPATTPPALLDAAHHLVTGQTWLESHTHAIAPQLISSGAAAELHHGMGIKSLLWWPWAVEDRSCHLLALEQTSHARQWQRYEYDFLADAVQLLEATRRQLTIVTAQKTELTQAQLEAVAFYSNQAILITDANAVIQRVNPAFTRVTGYQQDDVIGKNPNILKSGRQNKQFYKRLWKSVHENGFWTGEIWNRRKNGEIFPEWQSIAAVKDDSGNVSHYVATFHDITERKQAEAYVKRLAYYDSLTGLPNRALLMDRLQQTLATAKRQRKISALLFMDLDRFKMINDSLGHSAGDTLLCQTAKRLSGVLREEDTVARLGGDEFVIVLAQLNNTPREAGFTAQTIAERIRKRLGEPYLLRGTEYQSKPSIGIALFPEESSDSVDNILKHADAAMYRAKGAGGDTIRFYQPGMQAAADERLTMENALRHAVNRDELLLHYQPQVDISGTIVGAEALLRWQPSGQNLIPPATFIPIAEETGHIIDIGAWVLRTAVREFKQWLERGICAADAVVAVNVSPRQFRQADLEKLVNDALNETGLNPRHLKIEITEGTVMSDIDDAIAKIDNLRSLGVDFAIDDFGTGHSSLAYLRRLPLSQLKIDKSFVQDITTDRNAAAIVETIIAMARHLNLEVLAEGVEQEAQMNFLSERGCHRYQGYYFSRPLAADQFEAFALDLAHRTDPDAASG